MHVPELPKQPAANKSVNGPEFRRALKSMLKFGAIWFSVTIVMGLLISLTGSSTGDKITGVLLIGIICVVGCVIIGAWLYCALRSNSSTTAKAVSAPTKPVKNKLGWWWYQPLVVFLIWRIVHTEHKPADAHRGLGQSAFPNASISPQFPPSQSPNFGKTVFPSFEPTRRGIPSQASGTVTANYWMATVFQMVRAKEHFFEFFEPLAENRRVSVSDVAAELDNWSAAIAQFKAVNSAGADIELVAIVQTHFGQDTELTEVMHEMVDRITKSGRTQITSDDEKRGIGILTDQVQVDPAAQPLVERLQRLWADQEKQISKIDVIRGKLSERYRSQSFPLPDDVQNGDSH
jgi:hypothetical protein